jgi:hypothetical protein
VFNVLTHPKYAGRHVFGRASQKLSTPAVRLPRSEWTIVRDAFNPIVGQETFDVAQKILRARTINKSDQELLDGLRALLKEQGLSLRLIKTAKSLPSPTVYRLRFGSLRHAYELIGYGRPGDFGPFDLRRRTQALREDLISRLQELFPGQLSIVRPGSRWCSRLRLRHRLTISVLVTHAVRTWRNAVRSQIDPVRREKRLITLLARLDTENRRIQDYHLLPNVNRSRRFTIKLKDQWLQRGMRLAELQHLFNAVERGRQHTSR